MLTMTSGVFVSRHLHQMKQTQWEQTQISKKQEELEIKLKGLNKAMMCCPNNIHMTLLMRCFEGSEQAKT